MNKPSSVALVMVNFNQKDLTAATIEIILLQTLVPHIIVVDNCSSDGSATYLSNRFPQITILCSKKNLGGSGGQHLGSRFAYDLGFTWIILTDNDAVPKDKDLIHQLVSQSSPTIVSQPWNIDEDFDEGFSFIPMHFGCFHRQIFSHIGFPVSHYFYGDDLEFINRLSLTCTVNKLKNVTYSHPYRKTMAPSRHYFVVRNLLHINQQYLKLPSKLLYFTLAWNNAFSYLFIKEFDYFRYSFHAIIDYLLSNFSYRNVTRNSSIKQPLSCLSPKIFQKRFTSCPSYLSPLGKKNIHFTADTSLSFSSFTSLFFHTTPLIIDRLSNYYVLSLFTFSSVLIAIDHFEKDKIYFRSYPTPSKLLHLLLLLPINLPLLILLPICLLKIVFFSSFHSPILSYSENLTKVYSNASITSKVFGITKSLGLA